MPLNLYPFTSGTSPSNNLKMDNFTAVQGDRAKSYAIIACAVSVFYTIFRVFTIWRAQVKVPLAGADKMSVFAFMKARQRRFTDMWGLLEDGYKKVNTNAYS